MSTSNQTASPSHHFTAIFEVAKSEYQKVTGKSLDTHTFAAKLVGCDGPEAFSNVLQIQAEAFSSFCKRDEKLMKWLRPIVNVLFTFSGTIGEGAGITSSPAKTIVTGIGILLVVARDVIADNDKLVRLFERIHFFLQRLNKYTKMPLANEWTELLGKIMAQILFILALSTRAMTERRLKKYFKKLIGKTDVEDVFLWLESLTKEESLMAVAKNLEVTFDIDGNVKKIQVLAEDIDNKVQVIEGATQSIDQNVKAAHEQAEKDQRNQLQEKIQRWLSPPDPFMNHNNACRSQHHGTARWFIEGSTFQEWKKNSSLLWIRGNPGAGKSVLCSAIIEEVKKMGEGSALLAYHYFDFKDISKRHVRDLMASLLFQLSNNSDRCWDVLHGLYGRNFYQKFETVSYADLSKCFKSMVELPGQIPVFIIIDALDECPNTTGTPSAREEVLDFVEDLVGSNYSNMFLCITSRPEQDIQTVLNPLTSASHRVALHEESGQREDINNYIRHFVHTDRDMRRWREDDKAIVIDTLSARAGGMFRWVYCQLDTLRRCFPSSIRKILDELPTTLNETYERTLEGIHKEKRQHAHRLFQCLVAAIRPLHVIELAEIFAIESDPGVASNFMEGWRPENPEEAILSACSTLISVVDDELNEGSKIVQFSHFTVKEFLTSDRIQTSEFGNARRHHIPLDDAHTILAHVCLTVLLQLDERTDRIRLSMFPLALYAAQHWFDHAKYEAVAPRVQNSMEQLFNPTKPYLAAWVWIHDVDVDWFRDSIDTLTDHPSRLEATSLYYATSCGFGGLVKYLICAHGEDVNARCDTHGSPLHVASRKGYLNAASVLLEHGANVNMSHRFGTRPLNEAYYGGHLELMRLLLEHGALPDLEYGKFKLLMHEAAYMGRADVIHLLLQHHADVNKTDSLRGYAPLHWASSCGHVNVAQILLEHGADINAYSDHGTPLFWATEDGHLEVVRLLLGLGADVHVQSRAYGLTPFQMAIKNNHSEIAQLLLEHGAEKE